MKTHTPNAQCLVFILKCLEKIFFPLEEIIAVLMQIHLQFFFNVDIFVYLQSWVIKISSYYQNVYIYK